MAVTSSRTLRLLSLLQSQRHWPGAVLAGRLGVSIRTLRRDIDRLRELGYPVSAAPGVAGGYALARGASLPPLVLDDDEAVALAVGLSLAATSGVAGLAEPSVQALAKVVPVMPARLRRRIDALRTATSATSWDAPGSAADDVDPDVLTALALAARDTERLVLGYTTNDGVTADRTVDPAQVVSLGRRWYLLAWDLDRVDWRVFRLDRIHDPRGTGTRFVPRTPPTDAPAYVRERVSGGPARHRVQAIVHAPADAVRRRVPAWLPIEPDGDDRCRVDLEVSSLLWGAAALGMLGAPFTVLGPPELGEELRAVAARMVAGAAAAPDR